MTLHIHNHPKGSIGGVALDINPKHQDDKKRNASLTHCVSTNKALGQLQA